MYGNAPRRAFAGDIPDLGVAGTTVRLALLTTAYTPDRSTHEVWDDVNADEVSDTSQGYTAGGEEVTTKTLEESTNVVTFDGDDVTWAASTIDAGYAVLYVDTGDATTSHLLTLVDFEGQESSEDGDFTIEWDANGIFQIDAS